MSTAAESHVGALSGTQPSPPNQHDLPDVVQYKDAVNHGGDWPAVTGHDKPNRLDALSLDIACNNCTRSSQAGRSSKASWTLPQIAAVVGSKHGYRHDSCRNRGIWFV